MLLCAKKSVAWTPGELCNFFKKSLLSRFWRRLLQKFIPSRVGGLKWVVMWLRWKFYRSVWKYSVGGGVGAFWWVPLNGAAVIYKRPECISCKKLFLLCRENSSQESTLGHGRIIIRDKYVICIKFSDKNSMELRRILQQFFNACLLPHQEIFIKLLIISLWINSCLVFCRFK